jgi:hypothetical protein
MIIIISFLIIVVIITEIVRNTCFNIPLEYLVTNAMLVAWQVKQNNINPLTNVSLFILMPNDDNDDDDVKRFSFLSLIPLIMFTKDIKMTYI